MSSMISATEQEYLYKLAQREYSGQGHIIDLGCWLCASTVAMAKGLAENPHSQAQPYKIHAYDLFIWEAWMERWATNTPFADRFKPGDSFLEACQERMSPWKDRVEFHPGDLIQIGWKGEPIELLFIDAMKNWETANSIIHDFFPYLIPGRSIIVHQDYSHPYVYWIYLTMYRLREYFEPICDIPFSTSLVFKYKAAIPPKLLSESYSLATFSVDELQAAFDYASQLVTLGKRSMVLSGKIRAFADLGDRAGIESSLFNVYDVQCEILYRLTYFEEQNTQLQVAQEALQTKLLSAEEQCSLQQAELQSVHSERSSVRSELSSKQAKLNAARSKITALSSQLAEAEDRIRAMETSKFWQLRTLWFRVKKLLGLAIE